ncbi:MAG: pentapeptide repeat-containing protein, partial [Nitrospinae bacterium]|nr:pentapeptide repeat-containing protein [Nitrospinota bacterium]
MVQCFLAIDGFKRRGYMTIGVQCKYQFNNKTICREPADVNSDYCFWHNPSADKSPVDIKNRLEEKHKKGDCLEGYQLENASLENIHLMQADLRAVNFKRANLRNAHLFQSNLSNACLFKADIDKANLKSANLDNTDLLGAVFGNADLHDVHWGEDQKVKNEREGDDYFKRGDRDKAREKYFEAEEVYRSLKNNFKNRGFSYEAGKYYYREMVVKRKQMTSFSPEYVWSALMDMSTGYGEKPYKIISFSMVFVLIFSMIFGFIGIQHSSGRYYRLSAEQSLLENLAVLYDSFYYSMVNFVTLGYGDYTPIGIGKMLAVFEALSGEFMIALFIITVYK